VSGLTLTVGVLDLAGVRMAITLIIAILFITQIIITLTMGLGIIATQAHTMAIIEDIDIALTTDTPIAMTPIITQTGRIVEVYEDLHIEVAMSQNQIIAQEIALRSILETLGIKMLVAQIELNLPLTPEYQGILQHL